MRKGHRWRSLKLYPPFAAIRHEHPCLVPWGLSITRPGVATLNVVICRSSYPFKTPRLDEFGAVRQASRFETLLQCR
jgi:hypothetical protein